MTIVPDDLDKVIQRYGNESFGDLKAPEQAEYLSAIAKRGGVDGATSVLTKLGLNDDDAAGDIKDLRELLRGCRSVRRGAWLAFLNALGKLVAWIIILTLAALFIKSDSGKNIANIIGP